MKKVLFRTYGDSKFGMGHVYRSLALADFLAKEGLEVTFAISDSDSPELQARIRGFASIRDNDLPGLDPAAFSYLIYDMPFLDERFFNNALKIDFEKRVGLDFFFYKTSYVDLAINLFSHGDPAQAHFQVEEGIQFAILRDKILKKPRNQENSVSALRRLLLTFGSADPQNNTCKALRLLPDLDTEIRIILGPLFSHKSSLETALPRFSRARVKIHENVQNIEDHMIESDLILCGGGTTLLESVYLCRPALVLAQTPEEMRFSNHLSCQGLCSVVNPSLETSINFSQVSSPATRSRIAETCAAVQIGEGKKLIFNRLVR